MTSPSGTGLTDPLGGGLSQFSSLDRKGLVSWLIVCAAVALSFHLAARHGFFFRIEEGHGMPIPEILDTGMDWFVSVFKAPFRLVSWLMEWPIGWFRALYLWLPWPFLVLCLGVLGYVVSGRGMALFCGGTMVYLLALGYWDKAALTLALISVSLPLAVTSGLAIGILGHRSLHLRDGLNALLDFMQTVPAFAYLIPCLILFGFGPTVGLIASAIYAIPPMARNVMLGLARVPENTIEAARMSGANPRQMLWLVKVPSAMPTILVGLNQTILATLSMVVIAAVLGSGEDLGWEVLDKMRRAEFGKSLLAGLGIVLIAMVLDRLTQAFARKRALRGAAQTGGGAARLLGGLLAALVVLLVAGRAVPALQSWPEAWVVTGGGALDDAVAWINSNYPQLTTSLKNQVLFYFMLPLKSGLDDVVRPFSWGFQPGPAHLAGYLAVVAAGAAWLVLRGRWRAAIVICYAATILFFGLVDMPWPAVALPLVFIAWSVAGARLALFTALALAFILVNGLWQRAMISVYLCGSAVLICVTLGLLLGVWAAQSDRFSRFIRPVNDTLQSIPLFVFLIPVVALFKVGEFAGLLAIIMYAIVPVIRYTEHGIRQVSREVTEAAQVMGCTRRQLLVRAQLPLALPEIMLGINQTVLFALAMLVVTALIGTKGLGQVIYQSLSTAGFGLGISAGLSMAFIAMITDRIIQTWSRRRKAELGLEG